MSREFFCALVFALVALASFTAPALLMSSVTPVAISASLRAHGPVAGIKGRFAE